MRIQLDTATGIGQCGLSVVLGHTDHRAQCIRRACLVIPLNGSLNFGTRLVHPANRQQDRSTQQQVIRISLCLGDRLERTEGAGGIAVRGTVCGLFNRGGRTYKPCRRQDRRIIKAPLNQVAWFYDNAPL
ncbi:MAG: hypothetical protein WBN00_02975, partial [Sedimenticolaceae bacterium]